ncbi:RHS repeat-associated core domain-containing protein [Lysobacter enzymogenes]|uniref:RHS repeat-associated core domain-containing protein n=1 Tax=Lysobacter enzymogenes TaxID=69 RepID=UPI00384E78F1
MKNRFAACALLPLVCAASSGMAQTVVEYIHTDALGTPVAITDAAQNVVERPQYEPYGRTLASQADGPGYTGHVTDAATGLVYMQQRYYDAELGRFLSADPVAARSAPVAGFNRYLYAMNNPYKFKDPDGRWVCKGGDACTNFEKALGRVAAAASNPRLNEDQRGVMRKIVSFYGPKGDARVGVSFSDGLSTDGAATMRKDGGHDIQFNMARLSAYTKDAFGQNFGRQAAHEGQHGVDDRARGRAIETLAERKATEVNSYTTAAYFQQAENVAFKWDDGWTPVRGFSRANIENQAMSSVRAACAGVEEGSCK